jgi:hypothetical protein
MRRLYARVAVAACLAVVLAGTSAAQPVVGNLDLDHRYRIKGAIRLLLVWISAEDVGGARIVRSGIDGDRATSLVIGSDPQRAPKKVNEWGYLREVTSGGATTVFGLRTLTDGNSPHDAERRLRTAGNIDLGLLCSTISPSRVSSLTSTVSRSSHATLRDLAEVITDLQGTPAWIPHDAERPSDVAPGFLGAMDSLMRDSAAAASGATTRPAVPSAAYVYKDAVFDVAVRRVERLSRFRTRLTELHNLIRVDLVVTNRSTSSKTDFSITYGTEGSLAGVLVHARYQPRWWFKVELALDEEADVPRDPASDDAVRARIDSLCRTSAAQ